ncbi:hypothetical protein M1555_03095 [Patescibacteria group bacterium]|nr:hypothetical protein [Patescibacteria group bacterium]
MKLSGKELVILTATGTAAVLLSLSQTILYWLKTPSGTYYSFAHNYIEDYYWYLQLMRQGWEGMWKATSWLTPEVYPAQFVNPFFLFLGHIARWSGIGIPQVYTLARVGGAMGLYLLIILLAARLYRGSAVKRVTGVVFAVFGTSWWGWVNGAPAVAPLVHAWTALDPVFRMSYIPHHLWSKTAMLAAFVFLTGQSGVRKNRLHLFLPAVAVILMSFISPVTIVTFAATVVLWLGLEYLTRTSSRRALIPLGMFALSPAVLIAWYHRMIEGGVFPWNSYNLWETTHYAISALSYLEALGPLFLLFLAGLPFLGKSRPGRLLIAWVASGWLLLFVLAPFLPLTNSRYLDGYQFIPIGVGAVAGVWQVAAFLGKKISCSGNIILYGCIALILLYSALGLWASIRQEYGYILENSENPQVYVPDTLIKVFTYLRTHAAPRSLVMAPYWIGTMIPALTGDRVIAGHAVMTEYSPEKQADLTAFYRDMTSAEARSVVLKYHPGYILTAGTTTAPYGTVAYRSGQYALYRTSY